MELIAATLAATYTLWAAFLGIMNLKQAQAAGTLPRAALVLGLPLIVAGYVLDVALNLTLATLLFFEWPREKTISERLSRWSKNGPGRRNRAAVWVLSVCLDPFDRSGGHRAGQ